MGIIGRCSEERVFSIFYDGKGFVRMANEQAALAGFKPGLEGVVGAVTQIAEVDGANGRLTLRGYDISELAGRCSAEEVAYLLWNGKLPTQSEFDSLKADVAVGLKLPDTVIEPLRAAAKNSQGMHAMRIGASLLSISDPNVDDLSVEASRRRAAKLFGQMGAVFAHAYRINQGQELIEPKPEHGLAESILYMQRGTEPSQAEVDGLNAYMVAVAEHGLNVSTFAARVTVSTDSDMVSGLTSAVGGLKGPKHGGVPGPVLDMLNEIGTPDKTGDYIRNEMTSGRRIMGFGHRIYKVRDPRAAILGDAAERMAQVSGDRKLLDLTQSVEAADGQHSCRAETRSGSLRKRRIVRRINPACSQCPVGHVHADVRGSANRGLDGSHDRAVVQQPHHSPGFHL